MAIDLLPEDTVVAGRAATSLVNFIQGVPLDSRSPLMRQAA